MATQTYLAITDGTTTCTFEDGAGGATNYHVLDKTWAPAVAGRNQSELGGRGPYADVTESLQIGVSGSTAAACLTNVRALVGLMEQAERFSLGYAESPVLLKYSPRNATSTSAAPMQALITGRASGPENSAVGLSPNFERLAGRSAYSHEMPLAFRRAGWWIGASASASGSAANPGTFSAGLATHPTYSPTKLQLSGFAASSKFAAATQTRPILLIANSGAIGVTEAEAGTATGYTSVSSAGARSGSILRYTPTGTSEATSGLLGFSGGRLTAVYASLRNTSGSTTWKIRVDGYANTYDGAPATYARSGATTNYVDVDTSTTDTRHVYLGILASQVSLAKCKILITASSASGTLDIDYLAFLNLSAPTARAIVLNPPDSTLTAFPNSWSLVIDDQSLTAPRPIIYMQDDTTALQYPLSYEGDATPISNLTTYVAFLMATQGAGWTYVSSGTTAANLTLTATRRLAYLTPE